MVCGVSVGGAGVVPAVLPARGLAVSLAKQSLYLCSVGTGGGVNGVLENVEYYYDKGVLCECTAEEYLLHKKKGSIIQIQEDFESFLKNLVI